MFQVITAHLSYLIVFWKPVVVEDGKHERFVKSLSVGQVFELEGLVEERVEGFTVHLGLELLLTFGLGQQVDLGKERSNKFMHSAMAKRTLFFSTFVD